jgi:hypothetical protein
MLIFCFTDWRILRGSEIMTAMLIKVQLFYHMTLSRIVNSVVLQKFVASNFNVWKFQGWTAYTLMMALARSSETSVHIYHSVRRCNTYTLMYWVHNFSLKSAFTKFHQKHPPNSELTKVDTVFCKCHKLCSNGKFSKNSYLKETSGDNCHFVLFTPFLLDYSTVPNLHAKLFIVTILLL